MQEQFVKNEISRLAQKYNGIEKVVLFGSRARGDFHRTSDFDLCVFCQNNKEFNEFYFDVDDIDTYYSFDILQYEKITNEELKIDIQRDGVILYESDKTEN